MMKLLLLVDGLAQRQNALPRSGTAPEHVGSSDVSLWGIALVVCLLAHITGNRSVRRVGFRHSAGSGDALAQVLIIK
jgi:hypothetical protein